MDRPERGPAIFLVHLSTAVVIGMPVATVVPVAAAAASCETTSVESILPFALCSVCGSFAAADADAAATPGALAASLAG